MKIEVKIIDVLTLLDESGDPIETLKNTSINYEEFVNEALTLMIQEPELFQGTFLTDLVLELMFENSNHNNTYEIYVKYKGWIKNIWYSNFDMMLRLYDYERPYINKEDELIKFVKEELLGLDSSTSIVDLSDLHKDKILRLQNYVIKIKRDQKW